MSKIKLSSAHLSGHELPYIQAALDENQVSVYGENLTAFENELEHYLAQDVKVACTISGTAALHLALMLANVTQGDEVLCQNMTYAASVNPVLYQKAMPIFIGSEQETWNMCPKALEEAIKDSISAGKKPKAIIVVHSYGMPAKMDEILALASQYNIILIEDAAEALGASYKGQKCGTFGDFSMLSFNGNKIITTAGGGAIVCKNEAAKNKAIFLATQARDQAPHYQHSEIGYNYRMSNINAAIGRGQMKVLKKHISLRRENNQFYKDAFAKIKGITLLQEVSSGYISNHWLTCILIDEDETGCSREDVRLHLQQHNIESRPLWKPLHLQPIFAKYAYYGTNYCEKLFKTGLCLPSGSNLTTQEKQRIVEVIASFLA
ncbi:DegT/DnrJ/EryC1/StrS family aminotransferase [Kordia jejudonensis]|uniref:DegT/DnrJ/EryC1/StrS family aminotransferase n=1 Tax=Kordia jejudonensis TaxID=1348245 RepID=UPI0006298D76|nr:aminotransferase class I/II-fold pyridoxal phosphate-dependent enzyme [Kordia jejudonensis]